MPQQTITIDLESQHDDVGFFAPGYPTHPSTLSPIAFQGYLFTSSSIYGGSPGFIPYSCWLRFKIPLSGIDRVDSAFLKLTDFAGGYESQPASCDLSIVGHNVDNGANPISYSDAITQSTTEATPFSMLDSVELLDPGEEIHLFELRSIINFILARTGWVTNNYMVFLWNSAHPEGQTNKIFNNIYQSDSYRRTPYKPPQLVITYTPGVGSPAYDQQVVSDIDIVSIPTSHLFQRSLDQNLAISQDVSGSKVWGRSVESTLFISQTPRPIKSYNETPFDLVTVRQSIVGNRARNASLESSVDFVQDVVANGPRFKTVHDTIGVTQDITNGYIKSKTVNDTLNFTQLIAQTPKNRTVQHLVNIQPFTILETVLQNPDDSASIITVSQDITQNTVRTRSIEHILDIVSVNIGYVDPVLPTPGGGGRPGGGSPQAPLNPGGGSGRGQTPTPTQAKSYKPSADSSVNFPPLPSVFTPTPSDPTSITLNCSALSLSITLPAPLFSNREELLLTRIQRHTRGGALKTFSEDTWPKIRTFRYKFDSLTTDKIEEFFTFLSQTLGQLIRLTDYEGRQWDGFIVNPAGESAQFFQICGKTTEFDFDGVEVS